MFLYVHDKRLALVAAELVCKINAKELLGGSIKIFSPMATVENLPPLPYSS
jgi:hypothetical protein